MRPARSSSCAAPTIRRRAAATRRTAARCKATMHWVSAERFHAGRGAALQSAVHQARSERRRGLRRRPQSEVAGSAERRPRRAGARGRSNPPSRCSSSGRAISAAIRIPRPAGRCSTAPSDCATPSPRRSAAKADLRSAIPAGSLLRQSSARGGVAHGGLGHGRRGSGPGRNVGRRGAARAARSLGPAAFRTSAAPPPSVSATGRSPIPGPGGCCRGCRSRSASASRSISPPTASRPGGRRSALGGRLLHHRHSSRGAGRSRFRLRSALTAVAAGFAVATLKTVADRASGPGAAGRQRRRSRASSRCARSASAPTASWCARCRSKAPAWSRSPTACGSRCRRARRRRSAPLSTFKARLSPAARAAAARRLRLRPRSLFPGHRRDRLRARRDQARRGAVAARAVAALRRRRSRACATAIDARIRACLPGDKGAIASALITGKRDAISAPVNDAMYISSLAHVLSISGYHMALVAGVVFFVLRALFALIPGLASAPPDQEMGGGRRAGRGVRLSPAVGRRGRDPALLHHDRHRADRRDGRPAGADAAHARASRRSACCCSRRRRSCIRASRCRLRRRWR